MKYRALFIGGPLDGQEKILREATLIVEYASEPHLVEPIRLGAATTYTCIYYQRLFAFGSPQVFIYSVWDAVETLEHVWHQYTGGRYA